MDREVAAGRVGLVSCVKTKRSIATAAKDLYISPLFRGQRQAVEAGCDRWFILSAKHGLLAPNTVIAPYDDTPSGASRARTRVEPQGY